MPEDKTSEMDDATQTEPQATGETPTAADLQAELGRTRKALADANREAAQRRKKLEGFEQAEAARKTAEMTELERVQAKLVETEKRAAEAEAGRRDALVRAAVIAKATGLRFQDPGDALRYVDASKATLADDGTVAGIDEQLDALAKARPYLLQPQGAVGPTNPGRGQSAGETDDARRRRLYGGGGLDPGPGSGYVPIRTS